MTLQELRNSILQLAMQGKLVEQRPEEGTAEELFAQIQEKKQQLIKEGKIKKEKSLPEITEDEKPFELPESWMWCRFGHIVNIVSARRVHKEDWQTSGIPFYRAREIAKLADYGFVDNELFISEKLYDEFSKSGIPHPGDLMVTAVGTLGKCYIIKKGDKFYYKDASVICLENYAQLLPDYLKFIMQSEMLLRQIRSNSSGTTVATLTIVRMAQYLLPLPPLAEQERIVAKLEELLPLVDAYGEAAARLDALEARFPGDLRKSLLQEAVSGHLVPQRAEDGTADALYAEIQQEKARLIAEKKIKKEKPLPPVTDEEKPFDIPKSWIWCRLNDIVIKTIKRGKSPTYTKESNILVFAQKCNTKAGYIDLSLAQYLDETKLSKYPEEEFMVNNDIVLNSTGQGTLGRIGIYHSSDNPNAYPVVPDSHVTIIRVNPHISIKFVFYFLKYCQPYMEKLGSGSTKQTELSAGVVKAFPFPLPPLAEQERIVAKLEELLPLTERLAR